MNWQVDVPAEPVEEVFEQPLHQPSPEAMDPRKLYDTEAVAFDDVGDGDWIAARSWSRPRRVELVEHRNGGAVLLIADPDESRTDENGIRAIDAEGWTQRGEWFRFPNLKRVWERAHQ